MPGSTLDRKSKSAWSHQEQKNNSSAEIHKSRTTTPPKCEIPQFWNSDSIDASCYFSLPFALKRSKWKLLRDLMIHTMQSNIQSDRSQTKDAIKTEYVAQDSEHVLSASESTAVDSSEIKSECGSVPLTTNMVTLQSIEASVRRSLLRGDQMTLGELRRQCEREIGSCLLDVRESFRELVDLVYSDLRKRGTLNSTNVEGEEDKGRIEGLAQGYASSFDSDTDSESSQQSSHVTPSSVSNSNKRSCLKDAIDAPRNPSTGATCNNVKSNQNDASKCNSIGTDHSRKTGKGTQKSHKKLKIGHKKLNSDTMEVEQRRCHTGHFPQKKDLVKKKISRFDESSISNANCKNSEISSSQQLAPVASTLTDKNPNEETQTYLSSKDRLANQTQYNFPNASLEQSKNVHNINEGTIRDTKISKRLVKYLKRHDTKEAKDANLKIKNELDSSADICTDEADASIETIAELESQTFDATDATSNDKQFAEAITATNSASNLSKLKKNLQQDAGTEVPAEEDSEFGISNESNKIEDVLSASNGTLGVSQKLHLRTKGGSAFPSDSGDATSGSKSTKGRDVFSEILADGTRKTCYYAVSRGSWCALFITPAGVRRTRTFSCNKWGFEMAKVEAQKAHLDTSETGHELFSSPHMSRKRSSVSPGGTSRQDMLDTSIGKEYSPQGAAVASSPNHQSTTDMTGKRQRQAKCVVGGSVTKGHSRKRSKASNGGIMGDDVFYMDGSSSHTNVLPQDSCGTSDIKCIAEEISNYPRAVQTVMRSIVTPTDSIKTNEKNTDVETDGLFDESLFDPCLNNTTVDLLQNSGPQYQLLLSDTSSQSPSWYEEHININNPACPSCHTSSSNPRHHVTSYSVVSDCLVRNMSPIASDELRCAVLLSRPLPFLCEDLGTVNVVSNFDDVKPMSSQPASLSVQSTDNEYCAVHQNKDKTNEEFIFYSDSQNGKQINNNAPVIANLQHGPIVATDDKLEKVATGSVADLFEHYLGSSSDEPSVDTIDVLGSREAWKAIRSAVFVDTRNHHTQKNCEIDGKSEKDVSKLPTVSVEDCLLVSSILKSLLREEIRCKLKLRAEQRETLLQVKSNEKAETASNAQANDDQLSTRDVLKENTKEANDVCLSSLKSSAEESRQLGSKKKDCSNFFEGDDKESLSAPLDADTASNTFFNDFNKMRRDALRILSWLIYSSKVS